MRAPPVAALAFLAAVTGPAAAGTPGDFDFYVLSLSWSPSWCEAEGIDSGMQCDGRRPFAFVLHGLWPQYERGWPDFCPAGPRREPTRQEVDAILPVMPDPRLVRHQWRKHGTCSGLHAGDYIDTMRAAFDRVAIPAEYRQARDDRTVDPDAVEEAFLAANPGLDSRSVAVTCDDGRLMEVRLCLTRDLTFRSCPEVDRRGCRRDRVAMPPAR